MRKQKEIEKLRNTFNAAIVPQDNNILTSIEHELNTYFENKLLKFRTPIKYIGSEFQIQVWEILKQISKGEIISYFDIAKKIGNLNKIQSIKRANGLNQLSIIIPCHRVIDNNGELGGYGGGIERKKWLLNHEGVEINESKK